MDQTRYLSHLCLDEYGVAEDMEKQQSNVAPFDVFLYRFAFHIISSFDINYEPWIEFFPIFVAPPVNDSIILFI